MTFVSATDARERDQEVQGYDPLLHGDTSFQETFAATVGQIFDEELSISGNLHSEMYRRREDTVKEMTAGGFDITPYQDDVGRIDYDAIAADNPDAGVATDLELYEERTAIFDQRRAYAEDVIERGSGFSWFLGTMTGYMLDPVNIVTMPIGASASALRGLSTVARIRRIAATEAAIGAGAELAIQPLVYAHKNEIGSPYEITDAITAMASASLGGAVLGGGVAGIAGLVRGARTLDLPDGDEARAAVEILETFENDLLANPERGVVQETLGRSARKFFQMDNEELTQQIILMKREVEALDEVPIDKEIALEAAEAVLESRRRRWGVTIEAERQAAIGEEIETLRFEEESRLSRGERKAIKKSIEELKAKRNAVEEVPAEPRKGKGVSARKAKAEAKQKAKAEANEKRAAIQREIDDLEARLETSRAGEEARANLSRVQQGIFPKRLQEALNAIEHKRMVTVDVDYLNKLEQTRLEQVERTASVETYRSNDVPEPEPKPKDSPEPDAPGHVEELARYNALKTKVNVVDGVVTDADAVIAKTDDVMDGLESAKVCAVG